MPVEERMDPSFAVFNNHKNNAGDRADKEAIEQCGQKAFDKHIAPLRESGIMAILNIERPKPIQIVWIALVTAFVNEGIEPPVMRIEGTHRLLTASCVDNDVLTFEGIYEPVYMVNGLRMPPVGEEYDVILVRDPDGDLVLLVCAEHKDES